ncbi:MAG: YcgN family cysteine cluster protein [Pseudomonadales bacterium]|nr:YcgN family cysteine cluster protein [Pseudomonadales bacterium]
MFWQERELEDLSPSEWEQLCDGCAKCCLNKLEDENTQAVVYTRVACRLLDSEACRCTDYDKRQALAPHCLQVTPAMARSEQWLPDSCAYRLVAQGRDLPSWHPLLSGDVSSTVSAGESVAGRVLSEEFVHPDGLDEHVITWVSV